MEVLPATDDREAPQTVTMEGTTHLVDLPDELILSILELLCRHCDGRNGGSFQAERDNHKGLVSFSKTCFRFHKLVRPYLFHHVCFNYDYLEIRERSWQGSKHEKALFRLLRSLAGDHVPDLDALEAAGKRSLANGIDDLATSIKHLEANLTPNLHVDSGKVGKKGPRGDAIGFDWLPEVLNRATQLEHLELHMELPLNKHGGFIWTMDRYGRDKYDSIKTLSLIYRADCYDKISKFDLRDTYMIINRCSNLATLEIHGIGGLGERFMEETDHVTSQLKTLRLTNCFLYLHEILILTSGIENLESFTLGRGELRRFQLIAEQSEYASVMMDSLISPANLTARLAGMSSHSLRHLELGPFDMKFWEGLWHENPSGTTAENLENIRNATIGTLRSFEKLEHVQLAQDSILGVPNMWTSRRGIPDVWPGNIPIEEELGLRRIDTSLPDPDGTRLVSMLPRTLKYLRLTHVNNNLADSLLTFASAVADGEFHALKEVSLHGQDPLMERYRYGCRFQIELLFALKRHWDFLGNHVLEKMKGLLERAGVNFSWDAMGSNRPPEGWPGNPMLQSLGMEPTPPMTQEEVAFKDFSKERHNRSIMLRRKYAALGSTGTLEEDNDPPVIVLLPGGRELHLNSRGEARLEYRNRDQWGNLVDEDPVQSDLDLD
ncbi:hypothetical protein K4K59_010167 [Colletotrichum sp. SAR11_240]|nr:hypothetical protein K4K59_010167 [Colletotrichum sp. SAR11_240]